jgi:hypothetical protein
LSRDRIDRTPSRPQGDRRAPGVAADPPTTGIRRRAGSQGGAPPDPDEPADRSMDHLEHVVAVLVRVAAIALGLMRH